MPTKTQTPATELPTQPNQQVGSYYFIYDKEDKHEDEFGYYFKECKTDTETVFFRMQYPDAAHIINPHPDNDEVVNIYHQKTRKEIETWLKLNGYVRVYHLRAKSYCSLTIISTWDEKSTYTAKHKRNENYSPEGNAIHIKHVDYFSPEKHTGDDACFHIFETKNLQLAGRMYMELGLHGGGVSIEKEGEIDWVY